MKNAKMQNMNLMQSISIFADAFFAFDRKIQTNDENYSSSFVSQHDLEKRTI